MKKVLLLVLAITVFSVFLSGVTTVRWSVWGSPAELPPYHEVIKQFEAANPDIKIELIHAPWSTYFDKIQAMMAAGDAPDVMFLHTIPSWVPKGVLEDLTDYVEKSNFPVDKYNQELLSTFMVKGRIYGFPRDNDTTVLFYNKKLFDEAGVPYPDYTWDWQKLLDASKKLTKTDNRGRTIQYAIVLERNKWNLWVYMNGGQLVDNLDYPTKCTMNERAAVEAIEFLNDLINEYKVAPNPASLSQLGSAAELFTTGRVAMVMSNAAQISSFLTNPTLDFGIAPLPMQVKRANGLGGAGFVMASTSKVKDAAWRFMEFLCGPEGQAIFASSGDAVPAMTSTETMKAFMQNPPSEYERRIFFSETANGIKVPQIPGWYTIFNEAMTRQLDYVWTGQKSAVEICEKIAEDVTKLIKEAGTW